MTPLTAEQAAIVDAVPTGPLRIDAGAGTGKTYTLVAAIESLVAAGTDPERILGVTFTNKAAGELASRVRRALAPTVEFGVEVDVHTYHGLAARFLREFGPFVGIERDTRVITPTFSRQLLHESVQRADGLRHIDLSAPSRHVVGDLLRLASAMADHLVDPESVASIAADDDVGRKRAELAGIVVDYVAEKRRLGVVDYADLIALSHRLVTEHPAIAERLRDRYDIVFLDEYQDTDPAQRQLLQALFADGRPVVAVGDADQTIYEWRGASLENFASFPEHFPTRDGHPAPTLPLTANRRSGAAILAVANALRSEISHDPRRDLVTAPGAPDATVSAGWYRTAVDEAAAIADVVVAHAGDGVPFREMAVLVRANRDIAAIRHALADAGVPSEVVSLGGLLDVPEIVEVHAWLRLINDPADSVAFARLAMGSQGRLGAADLRPLADWVREGDEDVLDRSLTEALDHLDALDLREEAGAVLAGLRTTLRELLRVAQGSNLVELVREILTRIDAWHDVESLPPAAALSARLNLYRFLDLAEQWSPLEGRPSLEAFLDHLELLREDPTQELDTARVSGEDAVALLTVHRAKGLEWDVVFVPTLAHGKFPSRPGPFEDPFARPWALPVDLRLDRDTMPTLDPTDADARRDVLRTRHERAEWRLAYVAATRARRHLHLSGAAWYGIPEPTKRPRSPSPIFEVATSLPVVDVVAQDDAGDRPELLTVPRATPEPDPLFGGGWAAAVRGTLGDPSLPRRLAEDLGIAAPYDAKVAEFQDMLFALPSPPAHEAAEPAPATSVSGLVTYARCPLQYFWSHVEPLPRRPNPAAARGVAVHRRIELHNLGHLPLDDAGESVYDVVDGGAGGRSAYATFLDSRFATTKPLAVEAPFELPIGPMVVRGRVDAIYGDVDHWEIVDFKSGRPPTEDPAVSLQLDAYGIAAIEGLLGPTPERVAVTFAYLGDGLAEQVQDVDDAWEAAARERLTTCVDGILDAAFDPAPSAACHRCDFLVACDVGRAFVG
jgi:DNA helicase-2/ATP-dependent DNA helicase PcrA